MSTACLRSTQRGHSVGLFDHGLTGVVATFSVTASAEDEIDDMDLLAQQLADLASEEEEEAPEPPKLFEVCVRVVGV